MLPLVHYVLGMGPGQRGKECWNGVSSRIVSLIFLTSFGKQHCENQPRSIAKTDLAHSLSSVKLTLALLQRSHRSVRTGCRCIYDVVRIWSPLVYVKRSVFVSYDTLPLD
jgi:hypothetical protein